MNVLQLCLSKDLGGLELYPFRATLKIKSTLNITTVINKDAKLKKYYDDAQLEYFSLSPKNKLFMLSEAKKLAEIIDTNKIDIVHFHWTNDMYIAVAAKLISKKNPILIQTRHMGMSSSKDDFFHRFFYTNVDKILTITKEIQTQLKAFLNFSNAPEIECFYLGTDIQEPLSQEEVEALRVKLGIRDFSVGIVGRIEQRKGQYLLIDAVEKLQDVNAYIVGAPMNEEYLNELKESVKQRNLQERVHFLGFFKEPLHFMQACDVIVLATDDEPFGLVLIEAMQAKTAVIGTSKGGVLEIIEDNINGLLFENRNSDELAQNIEFLKNNPDIKADFEKKAYATVVEKFDNIKHHEKLVKIYEKLYNKKKPFNN
ncbi:MAG: glycosyltransferase family 4 protein [Sulfurimonas sp.]|jgi:glycosyltransferase involved in cell wall biosynthesis